jgi:hypothetical protein
MPLYSLAERDFCMESEVRGRLEKELDRLLKPEVIDMVVKISENIPVKSVEDFCFGYIVGDIVVGAFEESRVRYGRDVSMEEMNEALNLIYRRALEVKGAIKLAMGK